ncbi:hypothetical protein [uncultured Fibrella sp.]|uniref:hypothetical protein n=1 Tax=uncultured Fibrella sp. TaxID=1284596 RepID=UPI0035CA7D4B
MKLSALLIALFIGILLACTNDDQVLGNRVAGQWTLTQIRYANPTRPGTDTTLVLQDATIIFDNCQYKRGESLLCTGQHQVFNGSTVPFNFDIDGVKQSSMSINQQYHKYIPKNADLDLNGGYIINFGDNDNQMELKGRYYLFGSKTIEDETAYFTLRRKQ